MTAKSKSIFRSKFVVRRGVRYELGKVSWVFACPNPDCEYVMTARTEPEALAIEDTHYKIAPSTHWLELADRNWHASPLSSL